MLRFVAAIHGTGPGRQLAVSFEDASRRLETLPRMFLEPDGSFVWTGTTAGGGSWQVDGNLIDAGTVLACVEVKGQCPPEQLDQLLAALDWPHNDVKFQLPQRGIYLDEDEFRSLAASGQGAK